MGGFKAGQINYSNNINTQDSYGNIITQNQNGHNILISEEKPIRKLDEDFKKEIDDKLELYKGDKIIVEYLAGNSEVHKFSSEIIKYLKDEGYEVSWISKMPFVGTMEGQSFYFNDEGIIVFSIGASV